MKAIEDPTITKIINEADHPVLLLVTSGECETVSSSIKDKLEEELEKSKTLVMYYNLCIPEAEIKFPRIAAPALYYFTPKNCNVAFCRYNAGLLDTLDRDLEIIEKMATGLTYEEAKFTPEELETVIEVEYQLAQEANQEFPPAFKQARTLAKEIWSAGKAAAHGLPVIVPAEVGLQRLKICEGCPEFTAENYRCKKCGCFMKSKTQIATSSCPLNKWEKYEGKPS